MFEIILKQDYEDFYFFREFEVNGVTNNPISGMQNAKPSLHMNSVVSKGAMALQTGTNSIITKFESPSRHSNNSRDDERSLKKNMAPTEQHSHTGPAFMPQPGKESLF